MTNKPQFVGERVRLGKLLLDTFSGEWGTEEGESLTPVLRTSNFNEDGSLDYSTPAIRCIPERKVAKKRMFRGDIILEKSGGTPKRPVGIMAFYDSDELALCSNFNQVLRFDEDRILSRFAFHQLRWLKDRNAFDRFTRKTTGLQNLQMKKLIELKLHVPQIEAQTTIADTLDKIVDNQRTLQREIIDLDSLVKSRFVEMFGKAEDEHSDFPVKTLNDVCTSIVRGPFGSALKKEFFVPKRPGAYKVYEQKHAIQKQVDIGTYYISSDRFETLKRFECHPGDILMSCSGTMGKLYQLPQNCEPGVMNQALCKFTLSNSILTDYFLGFMEQVVDELGAKGSGIKNVSSVKFIKAIRIPLPPVELQGRFAAFVSQVDKSRFVAQQQIEKLQMLYDSLAQEYFGD